MNGKDPRDEFADAIKALDKLDQLNTADIIGIGDYLEPLDSTYTVRVAVDVDAHIARTVDLVKHLQSIATAKRIEENQ